MHTPIRTIRASRRPGACVPSGLARRPVLRSSSAVAAAAAMVWFAAPSPASAAPFQGSTRATAGGAEANDLELVWVALLTGPVAAVVLVVAVRPLLRRRRTLRRFRAQLHHPQAMDLVRELDHRAQQQAIDEARNLHPSNWPPR